MKRTTTALVLTLVAAWSAIGCGSIVSDGGQSGTGVAAIHGNVVAAPGVELQLADIRVSLNTTDPGTRTDANGRFELRTSTSGPAELRFERERDGLSARTDVVVPTGGVLELSEIELDPESDEARPTMRRVEFEGIVQVLDCAGGAILVTPKEDETETAFTVEVASATIRQDNVPLACVDLRVGDRVQVDAETPDGSTLVNAVVVLENREDESNDGANQPGDDGSNQPGDDGPDQSGDDASDQPGDDGPDQPGDNDSNQPSDDSNHPSEDSNQPGDDGADQPSDSEDKPNDSPDHEARDLLSAAKPIVRS